MPKAHGSRHVALCLGVAGERFHPSRLPGLSGPSLLARRDRFLRAGDERQVVGDDAFPREVALDQIRDGRAAEEQAQLGDGSQARTHAQPRSQGALKRAELDLRCLGIGPGPREPLLRAGSLPLGIAGRDVGVEEGSLRRIDRGLAGVVRGQVTICIVNGVLTFAGLAVTMLLVGLNARRFRVSRSASV